MTVRNQLFLENDRLSNPWHTPNMCSKGLSQWLMIPDCSTKEHLMRERISRKAPRKLSSYPKFLGTPPCLAARPVLGLKHKRPLCYRQIIPNAAVVWGILRPAPPWATLLFDYPPFYLALRGLPFPTSERLWIHPPKLLPPNHGSLPFRHPLGRSTPTHRPRTHRFSTIPWVCCSRYVCTYLYHLPLLLDGAAIFYTCDTIRWANPDRSGGTT